MTKPDATPIRPIDKKKIILWRLSLAFWGSIFVVPPLEAYLFKTGYYGLIWMIGTGVSGLLAIAKYMLQEAHDIIFNTDDDEP